MVADIVPPDKRTSVFLYITAGVLIAELIAPILAAKLMDSGDWLPLLLALAIQQVGIFIGVGFPETLHLRDLPEPRDNDEESDIELQPEKARSAFAIKTQLRHFKDVFVFLKRDRQLTLVIFTFLANRLGRQALNLLIRYASKRYHWKIQKVCTMISLVICC
jgi:MFS family permease